MAKKKPARRSGKPPRIAVALQNLAVPLDSLVMDPANARKHGEENLAAIRASLEKFGQVKPIVVAEEDRQIIAGNGTFEVATRLGWTEIAAVILPLSKIEAAQLAIADNRSAELAEWDETNLLAAIEMIQQADADFAEDLLLCDLLPSAAEKQARGEPEEVTVPEVYGLNIIAIDEAQQRDLYAEFTNRGLTVKLVTM